MTKPTLYNSYNQAEHKSLPLSEQHDKPMQLNPKAQLSINSSHEASGEALQSGVLYSPADGMLRQAIAETLQAPAADRVRLFTHWVQEIESYVAIHCPERPWTCIIYRGTDGSHIFRGGVGHSLVIDGQGRLWRTRSYEDFDTTYTITPNSCEIESLTPRYAQMQEYRQL